MAKAEKAAVKKASNAAPTPVKPVKQTLTKSALINLIAEENEIPRKTASGVYATSGKPVPRIGPPTRGW